MKAMLIASFTLLSLLAVIVLNSVYIERQVEELYSGIDRLDIDDEGCEEKIDKIHSDFTRARKIITLSVSHDDISNIESCFAEVIGTIRADAKVEFIIAKSRLKDALLHLRRLSSINFDSIM